MNFFSFFQTHRKLINLWVLSLFISLFFCLFLYIAAGTQGLDPLRLMGDSRGYIILAENILNHGVFSISAAMPYAPESFRAPGYPFFLALLLGILGSWKMVLFAQAAILSFASPLLYLLMRPLNERAAWLGSLIFIFEPIHLFYSSVFLSDMLFVLLLLSSLLLLSKIQPGSGRFSRALISGVLLGAVILVRPIGIFLPILYFAYLLLKLRSVRQLFLYFSVLALGVVLLVGPWMIRNHSLFGSWGISSVGSANLVLYNAPEYLKANPDARGEEILENFRIEQKSLPREDALSLKREEVFTSTFFEIIQGREISYMLFHLVKTVPFFVTDGLRDIVRLYNIELGDMPNISTALLTGDIGYVIQYMKDGGLPVVLLIFGSGFWSSVFLLYLYYSFFLLRKKEYPGLFLMFGLVFYFALLTGPVSNARYRLPAEGFLLFGASAGLMVMLKKEAHVQV